MIRGTSRAVLAALALAPSPLVAQENDVRTGLMTAERLCAECHAVRLGDLRSPNSSAPTFVTMAGMPGMTSAALRVALNTSHRTGPNIMLSSDHVDAIIAYILSLRQPG
jgi:mono/diheme cytochrome c family protein